MSYSHLKRRRDVFEHGVLIIPRPSLIDSIVDALSLRNCNQVGTPMVADKDVDQTEPLDEARGAIFRSGVGCALYLAHDRCDVAYAVKELSRALKNPT